MIPGMTRLPEEAPLWLAFVNLLGLLSLVGVSLFNGGGNGKQDDLVVGYETQDGVEFPSSKQRNGDAGYDLPALQDYVIEPGDIVSLSTGVSLNMGAEANRMATIVPRSSVGLRGLSVLGNVIDSGYTGILKVIVVNMGSTTISLKKGDRFCQIVFLQLPRICLVDRDGVPWSGGNMSDRGKEGFGSTGK